MPSFTGFLNIEAVEDELAKSYRQSLQEKTLCLDLRKVEWLSPLSLSVLYSWAWEVVAESGTATVIPPETESFASSFFNSADVLARFTRHGLNAGASLISRRFRREKIAVFETFDNKHSFEAYIRACQKSVG